MWSVPYGSRRTCTELLENYQKTSQKEEKNLSVWKWEKNTIFVFLRFVFGLLNEQIAENFKIKKPFIIALITHKNADIEWLKRLKLLMKFLAKYAEFNISMLITPKFDKNKKYDRWDFVWISQWHKAKINPPSLMSPNPIKHLLKSPAREVRDSFQTWMQDFNGFKIK